MVESSAENGITAGGGTAWYSSPMLNGMGLKGFRVLAAFVLLAAPATAYAHAKLVTPTPRVDNDGLKAGPCGGIARTASFTKYDAGATIQVQIREGIDHVGCFQIAVSPANDSNWITLDQFADDGGTANTTFTRNVKLPDGLTCENCTLVARQLMQGSAANPGAPCGPDASPEMATQGTYYSCADIRIGDFPDAAPSADSGSGGGSSSGGSSGSSGGPTTVPSEGGPDPDDDNDATPNLRAGQGEDCSVGWGAAPGASLAVTAVAGLALLRRRRRR